MVNIKIINKTKEVIENDQLIDVINKALSKFSLTDNVEIELQFVGRVTMRGLNKEYRNHDYPTDVLSFPVWPNLDTIRKQKGRILLGSIIICLKVAEKQAKEENQTLIEQINFLIKHSIDHLVGIHHEGDN